jgi:hypothetical protein
MNYEIVAYELRKSLEHLETLCEYSERIYGEIEDFDALIYEPTQTDKIHSDTLIDIVPYSGPEPVICLGFLERLPHRTDFLNNDLLWPIMSRRMLYVLESTGSFLHKVIPIRIFDYSLKNDLEQYIQNNEVSPELCNEDYVAVQLLEHINVIDFEHSILEDLDPDSIFTPRITRLVLREPDQGFPPIFRLNRVGEDVYSYVSPQAKQALEEANIRGLEFIPEDGIISQNLGVSPSIN